MADECRRANRRRGPRGLSPTTAAHAPRYQGAQLVGLDPQVTADLGGAARSGDRRLDRPLSGRLQLPRQRAEERQIERSAGLEIDRAVLGKIDLTPKINACSLSRQDSRGQTQSRYTRRVMGYYRQYRLTYPDLSNGSPRAAGKSGSP